MDHDEAKHRFKNLPQEGQLPVLAIFGHNLTIVARDPYEFQAFGVRAPERLRAINEIQHRVVGHIRARTEADARRYPDDVLLSIFFELGDEHLQLETLRAMGDALQQPASREDRDHAAIPEDFTLQPLVNPRTGTTIVSRQSSVFTTVRATTPTSRTPVTRISQTTGPGASWCR